MIIVPCTISDAREYVSQHHRHNKAPLSALFALACAEGEQIVGVAIVGRPIARMLQDGWTAEITRCCTDGSRNACSMLYGAAWRAARAIGYRKLVTYTLASESGASLRAAGFQIVGQVKAQSWDRDARPRVDHAPLQAKIRWEVGEETGIREAMGRARLPASVSIQGVSHLASSRVSAFHAAIAERILA